MKPASIAVSIIVPFTALGTRLGGVSGSDDGNDFTYGIGARFSMTENLGLRLEYERFEMNDIDVDMASAHLQFDF